ncbi:hypothetical protein ACWDNI_01560 [Nocardia niigatensis]
MLEGRAKYLGRESLWCGELPAEHARYLAFAECRHCDDENHFPVTLHRCAAGLVAAHSRSAAARADPDDVIAAWELAAAEIVELEAEIDHAVAVRIPASEILSAKAMPRGGARSCLLR